MNRRLDEPELDELEIIIPNLNWRNSGDTAGDRDRVVGYGAFALREAA